MISDDHVTLKTEAENSAVHHRNKLQFNTDSHRKQLFKTLIIFHNIADFTVFFIKKKNKKKS